MDDVVALDVLCAPVGVLDGSCGCAHGGVASATELSPRGCSDAPAALRLPFLVLFCPAMLYTGWLKLSHYLRVVNAHQKVTLIDKSVTDIVGAFPSPRSTSMTMYGGQ